MELSPKQQLSSFPVVGCGVAQNILRYLLSSTLGSHDSRIAVCQTLAQCFMNAFASPFASGSSALLIAWYFMPAHFK